MHIIKEDEIKSLIGEAAEYDKKEMLEEKDPRSWCKSVSAFANGIGGSLIFGIADQTNEVVGLADAEGDSEKISRTLRDKMDPVPAFVLRFAKVDGNNLIILEIHSGDETPYYYAGRNERTAYYRVGNESVIYNVPSRRRNPVIADVFSRLIYMERRGSGFKKIIGDYQSQRNFTDVKMPKFLSQHDAFYLTLWNLNYVEGNGSGNGSGHGQGNGSGNGSGHSYGDDVIQRARVIAEYLRNNPESSINNTAETLELSRKQVVVAIGYLKDIGRLLYEGTNRKGHWLIRE